MDKFPDARFLTFWPVQIMVWTGYGVISFIASVPYVGLVPHISNMMALSVSRASFAVLGIVLSSGLHLIFQRMRLASATPQRAIPIALLLVYMAGLTANIATSAIRMWFNGPFTYGGWMSVSGGTLNSVAIFFAWTACYFGLHYYQAAQQEKEKALRSAALAVEAQLETLRYQLEPHFLFNSLNSIQALIQENPQRARAAVQELSGFLRHTLTQNKALEIPLSEEIAMTEKYLAMEKMRFEEKLEIRVKVQESVADRTIPTFLIHPLVENAIKYGMRTSGMPLRVHVLAEDSEKGLRIEVANSGRWIKHDANDSNGAGVGIRNVLRRLQAAYPDAFEFDGREQDGWVRAVILLHKAHS